MSDIPVQITARRCTVSDPIRTRTEQRVSKLQRFQPRLSHAEVVFTEDKNGCTAEAILSIDGADRVVAKGEGATLRDALDTLLEHASRLLRRQRERRTDHQGPPREGVLAED